MKYFKEIVLLKELGQEGKLTEQEVLAGIDRFDPTLGSFHDEQGAMRWLESQKIIGKKGMMRFLRLWMRGRINWSQFHLLFLYKKTN